VQACEDQYVENARFLKINRAVALYETSIAQQHGASKRPFIRPGCEKIVERSEEPAAQTSEPVGNSWRGMTHDREQLTIP